MVSTKMFQQELASMTPDNDNSSAPGYGKQEHPDNPPEGALGSTKKHLLRTYSGPCDNAHDKSNLLTSLMKLPQYIASSDERRSRLASENKTITGLDPPRLASAHKIRQTYEVLPRRVLSGLPPVQLVQQHLSFKISLANHKKTYMYYSF